MSFLLSFMPFCDNYCALTNLLVSTAQCDDWTKKIVHKNYTPISTVYVVIL